MVDQMHAVTGGRPTRPTYVAQINRLLPFLPAMIQQKKQDAYTEEMLGLQAEELDMIEDANKYKKKTDRIGMMLGVGDLGLKAYLGTKRNKALDDILLAGAGTKTAAKSVVPAATGAPFMSPAGAGSPSNWGKALSTFRPVAAGAAGYGAGSLVKKGKFKKAAVGAGVGMATDFVMSGGLSKLLRGEGFSADPYSMILSTALGAGASLFS